MTRAVLGLALTLGLGIGAVLGALAAGDPGGTASSAPSFADIVARVNPAVVHVSVVQQPGAPLDEEEARDWTPEELAQPRRGEGSGFVIDPAGLVLTNHHLVAYPSRIRVRFGDGRELAARLVGTDPLTDLAVLEVEASGLAAVSLGDSDRLRVGDWVCAIGNPYSFDHSVTVGVVSSKGRKIFDASFDAYIQTDAAINPGSSGGPLLSADGEVVGISAALSTEGQGLGFAIPASVAREVVAQLRARGRVRRGYLGVQFQDLDAGLQELLKLPDARGALVVDVLPGEPGASAGLARYDVIRSIAGRAIGDGDELVRTIAALEPGRRVGIGVLRDGRPLALEARLAERQAEPADPDEVAAREPAPAGDALGLEVAELEAAERDELRMPAARRGVVVQDVPGIAAGTDALEPGDLIVELNRRPTPDVAAYRAALAPLGPGQPAMLLVYRPGAERAFLARVEVEPR